MRVSIYGSKNIIFSVICHIKELQSITFHGSLLQQHYIGKYYSTWNWYLDFFFLNTTKEKEKKKENDRARSLSLHHWAEQAGNFDGQAKVIVYSEQNCSERQMTEQEANCHTTVLYLLLAHMCLSYIWSADQISRVCVT